MKNLFLIITGIIFLLIGIPAQANKDFENLELNKTILEELSFKNIMRAFYADKMKKVYVDDESFQEENYVGLETPKRLLENQYTISPNNQVKLDITEDLKANFTEVTYEYIAYMGKVITYKNTNNEERYLVPIITHAVSDGKIVQYRTAQAFIELFSFKKVGGNYQAVSRTPPDPYPSGTYGYPSWNPQALFPNLKKMGKNLVGNYTFDHELIVHGFTESYWEIIHLPENNFIDIFYILAGESNVDNIGDEDSPLAYNYTSTLNIKNENSEYYPLQIKFKGEKIDHETGIISKIDKNSIYVFDEEKYQYIELKQK